MKYQVLEKFLYKKNMIEYFKKNININAPPVNFVITFIV